MARRSVRASRASGTGRAFTVPAPYKGLNLRESRGGLPADMARSMVNFYPDGGKLTVRPGYVPHAALEGEDFSKVVLLCNFDGSDAATTSTDESESAHTLTFAADAQLDTAQMKFGASSLLLDGTGDFVTVPNSSDFQFGSGQFTIEMFVRLGTSLSSTPMTFIQMHSDADRGFWFDAYNDGGAVLRAFFAKNGVATSISVSGSVTMTTGAWYHVAADRDANGVTRLYLDGAVVGSSTDTSALGASTQDMTIGGNNGAGLANPTNGWVDSVRITKGLARYAGTFTAPTTAFPTDDIIAAVKTLAEHKGVTGRKMVAITTEGTAYNVSSTTAAELSAAGYTDGRFQTTNFNGYLFGVNGTDTPWRFDGTTWLSTGFSGSGLTITNLVNVANVRNRLWFAENDTADVWYGGIGSVTGSLTKFQLSQIASGGYCMAIGSWSRDSGAGADDATVFIMDTGQVIVYEGDPASTFSLVGKYDAPEPIGRKCTVKLGGDLVVITKSGFYPVSQIYLGLGDPNSYPVWSAVAPGVEADYAAYGSLEGWEGKYHKGVLYFNVPTSSNAAKQYVLNTRNWAWTTYNYPAYTFSPYGDDLYWSERAVGTINKVSGITDNGAAITCTMRGGFSYPGGASTNQQFTMMRPNITGKGTVTGRMTIDPDFSERTITGDQKTLVSGSGTTPWSSPWGSPWGSRPANPERWFTVNGMGRSVGVALEILTSASDVALDSIDLVARPGNIR